MATNGHEVQWIPELVKFLNLSVIVAIIYFFAGKAIKAALKSRSEDISKKIVDAKIELERMQYEADKAKKEIADIANIKNKLMDEMREAGLKTYEAMVADAKIAADRIIQDSKLAADNEIQSAIEKLKKQIVDQAVAQALKTVKEGSGQVTLHEKLVERFIGNLQEKEGMGHGI